MKKHSRRLKLAKVTGKRKARIIVEKIIQQEKKMVRLGGMPACSGCGEDIFVVMPYITGADFRRENGAAHGSGACITEEDWISKARALQVKYADIGKYYSSSTDVATVYNPKRFKIQEKTITIGHKRAKVVFKKLDKKLWQAEYNDKTITAKTRGELVKRLREIKV